MSIETAVKVIFLICCFLSWKSTYNKKRCPYLRLRCSWWWREDCVTTPNYLISQSPEKVVLRNFEGVITTYPEPENYIPGRADDYFNEVYPDVANKKSDIGVSGLLNDQAFNLVPEGISRLNRRQKYNADPTHSSLKEKREKRDELKNKKFEVQMKKWEQKEDGKGK